MQVSRTNKLEGGRAYHSIGRIKVSSGWRAVNAHGSEMDRLEALWALVSEAREFCADAVFDLCFEVEAIGYPDYEGATLRRIDGARLATDRRWLFHRPLLCRRNAGHQRRFVSSAPRARRRRAHCGRDFIKTVRKNPNSDGALGPHCGGGALRFFMGLTLVAPILGHATRHLYRKVIVRDSAQGQRPRGAVLDRNRRRRGQRSIARMIEANIFAAEVLKQLVNWQRRSARRYCWSSVHGGDSHRHSDCRWPRRVQTLGDLKRRHYCSDDRSRSRHGARRTNRQ
jgi:hypothetical protein